MRHRGGVSVGVLLCALVLAAPAFGAGSFTSSDPQLNAIWSASVQTAQDMLAPGPISTDAEGRPCAIDLPTVILDGTVRDRCPYVGDEAVINRTLDASTPHWDVQRGMLAWFAQHQHPDGSIPASPIFGGSLTLFDYNAYWLIDVYDYVLHSGDVSLAREVWPSVVRLLDGFYARHARPDGLVVNDLGPYDYGYIRRHGTVVAYYNAQYAVALRDASDLAHWVGDAAHAGSWRARAGRVVAAFPAAFWDGAADAYSDTTADHTTHPEDGNAFAVLAGVPEPFVGIEALSSVWNADRRSYGNALVDTQSWDGPAWGYQANQRVYPFIGFFDVCARFDVRDDIDALDLIRREWGYMLAHGPGTMWETIGPYGGAPTDHLPSYDAGWSSGAAPALTEYVLGVQPTSPGFATFTVDPHTVDIASASGSVPTPHGPIDVEWRQTADGLSLHVTAPPGTRWVRR